MLSRSCLKWSTAWALSLGIAVVVGAGTAGAVTTSASQPIGGTGVSKPTANGVFREIKWEDLVPKDWDPTGPQAAPWLQMFINARKFCNN